MMSVLATLAQAEVRYSAWAIYWDTAAVHADFQDYSSALSTVRLFACHFNESGDVISPSAEFMATPQAWKSPRAQGRPKFYLTFVNDVIAASGNRLKDPGIVRTVLSTGQSRSKHIEQILTMSTAFDGVEIDYENLYAADRPNFSLFIKELATALHARKQRLSVVVEPKTEEVDYDGPGAADWARLAEYADEIAIMAYFRHHAGGAPGALAPSDWVSQIVQYALLKIPASKLTLAFYVDAIEWSPSGGREIPWRVAEERRSVEKLRLVRPGPDRSVRYLSESGGVHREVWTEDAESLREKVGVVRRSGIESVSLWRLGSGDPRFWRGLPKRAGTFQRGNVKNKK